MESTSFYTEQELATLGLKSYGCNVLISRNAKFYSPITISIGNNVPLEKEKIEYNRNFVLNHWDYDNRVKSMREILCENS